MNDLNELTSQLRNGMISRDGLRQRLDKLKAVTVTADVTDCGDFRLRLVPWQP